jgi:DNA-binding MarR family transcriptional regulator
MPRPPRVHEEIRQSQPFPSLGQEATVTLLRTAAVVRRLVARAVEPAGISLAQYNVLRILRGAGTGGLATLAVRDRMVEEAPGVTRLLDKLAHAGLVRRDRTRTDRRQVLCAITPAGLALLDELGPAVNAADEAMTSALGEPALVELVARLNDVRAGLAAAAGCAAPTPEPAAE